jgi:hypothetical protein
MGVFEFPKGEETRGGIPPSTPYLNLLFVCLFIRFIIHSCLAELT